MKKQREGTSDCCDALIANGACLMCGEPTDETIKFMRQQYLLRLEAIS